MDGYEPVPDALPASLKRVAPMTISQVEEAIALRVDQRARDPAAQYREAYRLFGSPSDGITPAAFKYQLGKMGFIIAESELQRMFKLYDANDDGKISFQELASRLFSQTKKTQELWTAHRESDMAKRRAQLRDQLLKDAPHMQPRFRPPPGRSAPILSARTSQLSTGRSASTGAWSSTGRSSTGRSSTGRSSHLSTTVSLRARAVAKLCLFLRPPLCVSLVCSAVHVVVAVCGRQNHDKQSVTQCHSHGPGAGPGGHTRHIDTLLRSVGHSAVSQVVLTICPCGYCFRV